jgi:hypothetical protein
MLNEKEQRKIIMAALLMLEQACPYWNVYAEPVWPEDDDSLEQPTYIAGDKIPRQPVEYAILPTMEHEVVPHPNYESANSN